MSLALSVEHLRMIRVVISAGQLFPSATFTTLRGALVGGAQAVWVLGPDERAKRRSRGLQVLAEELTQLGKYYSEVDRQEPGKVPQSQWSWHAERTAQLVRAFGKQPPRLRPTSMIATTLTEAFPTNPDKQRSGRLLWSQMSSDAHVLAWGVAQRGALPTRPAKGQTLAVLAATGSLEHTAEAYLCAFQLVQRGWSLFDRRCEAAP